MYDVFLVISRSVAQELSDTILTMVANANVILKPRTAPPGVVGSKAGPIVPPTPMQGLPNPVGNNSVSLLVKRLP